MKSKQYSNLLVALALITASCQKDVPLNRFQGGQIVSKPTGIFVSNAAPVPGTLVDGATYRIRGLASMPSGTVVEVTGNSMLENAAIQQWSWFPNNGQKWKVDKVDAAYYKLTNLSSNKCLKSPSTTSGDILQQGTDDGSDSQRWTISYSATNRAYRLVNKATGMTMVMDPETDSPGAKISQKTSVRGTQDMFDFHNLVFQNPLINASRADPYVAQRDGWYYFMYTRGNNIGLRKTRSMSLLSNAPESVIWTPPAGMPYSSNIWAPELHFLSGKWYFYFAANDGGNDTHRMFVLENANADPMTGTWTFKGQITDPSDQWAIDGSILTIGSTNYFIWSGWESVSTKYKQYLYIAPMSNPWTISGARVKISSPTNDWEKFEPSGSLGAGVNEGPIILQKDSLSPVYMIYSASRFSSDNYCLAQIQLIGGGSPLVASSWINKKQVFVKNEANSVYGPGHNGFFTSHHTDPNGVLRNENWFIYHARSVPATSNGMRTSRMQKLTWKADGSPDFSTAASFATAIPIPVGE